MVTVCHIDQPSSKTVSMDFCLKGLGLSDKTNGNLALGMVNILGNGSQMLYLVSMLRIWTSKELAQSHGPFRYHIGKYEKRSGI